MYIKNSLFVLFAVLCLFPFMNAAHGLLLGLILAACRGVPDGWNPGTWGKKLLAYAVVGLGFGVNAQYAVQIGQGFAVLVMLVVMLTLLLSWWVTRWLRLDRKTGFLIGAGSAICGGSAIAAVAPAIQARSEQIAIALGCVFILNALALFIFPWVGHALSMPPETFGVWAAVAIHDTSSVVGAAQAYHVDAIAPATTLKLARALLIVPLVLLAVWLFATRNTGNPLRSVPIFLPFFVLAIVLAQVLPQGQALYDLVFALARQTLVLCLFFVGASMRWSTISAAGARPILLATLLWLAIAGGSLLYLTSG